MKKKSNLKDFSVPFSGWAITLISFLNEEFKFIKPMLLYIILTFIIGILLLNNKYRTFFFNQLKKIVKLWKLSLINKIIILGMIIITLIFWNGHYLRKQYKLIQISNELKQIEEEEINIDFNDLVDNYYNIYDELLNGDDFEGWENKRYTELLIHSFVKYQIANEIWVKTNYLQNRNLAQNEFKNRNYNLSIDLLEDNLKFLSSSRFSIYTKEYKIRTYFDLSECYRIISNFTYAETYLNDAKTLIEKINTEDSNYHYFNFYYHYTLAKIKADQLNYKMAINELIIANEFIIEIKEDNLDVYYLFKYDFINIYWKDNDFENALKICDLIETELLTERNWKSTFSSIRNKILTRKAVILMQIERLDEANSLLNEIFKSMGKSKVELLNFYSVLLNELVIEEYDHQYEKLMLDLIEEKKGLIATNDIFEIAKLYNGLAGLYLKRGDHEENIKLRYYYLQEAEKYYYKSYKLREEHLSEFDPRYTIGLNGLGVIYQRLEKYSKAENYFRKSLELRGLHNKNNFFYSQALFNLGFVLLYQNKFSEAIDYLEHSVILKKNLLGIMNYNYIDSFIEWIICLKNLDRDDDVKEEYTRLLYLLEKEGVNKYSEYFYDIYSSRLNK